MNNSCSWRNYSEVVECGLTPPQELVALSVSLIFKLNISLCRIGRSSNINYHAVVNYHFCRRQWVDFLRIAAKLLNSLSHSCQVNDAGNACEVLHDYPSWSELNFGVRLCRWIPVHNRVYVRLSYVHIVLCAQHVLKQNLETVGQLLDIKISH